jgi:hypothetical protein
MYVCVCPRGLCVAVLALMRAAVAACGRCRRRVSVWRVAVCGSRVALLAPRCAQWVMQPRLRSFGTTALPKLETASDLLRFRTTDGSAHLFVLPSHSTLREANQRMVTNKTSCVVSATAASGRCVVHGSVAHVAQALLTAFYVAAWVWQVIVDELSVVGLLVGTLLTTAARRRRPVRSPALALRVQTDRDVQKHVDDLNVVVDKVMVPVERLIAATPETCACMDCVTGCCIRAHAPSVHGSQHWTTATS